MSDLEKAYKTVKLGKRNINPKVIILMGLPGSGKSYVADYLNNKYGFTILSGENISNTLFKNDQNTDYTLVYKTLRQLAKKLLKENYSIVIDGTNLKYSFRKQIYDEVCQNTKPILIYLLVDDKTALERINKRGEDRSDKKKIKSYCSQETFNKFKEQIETPKSEENYYQIESNTNLFLKIDLIIN